MQERRISRRSPRPDAAPEAARTAKEGRSAVGHADELVLAAVERAERHRAGARAVARCSADAQRGGDGRGGRGRSAGRARGGAPGTGGGGGPCEVHEPRDAGERRGTGGRGAGDRAGGASTREVAAHLAIGARRAGQLRSQLHALEAAGALTRSRRSGFDAWAITARGRRRLRHARARGAVELPEAPQHRAWRHARTLALAELPRIEARLLDDLARARRLLRSRAPRSDPWLELAEQLRADARALASAIHCACEWEEPGDAAPDTGERDDPADAALAPARRRRIRALRAGRRNARLWSGPAR